jgi:hypothetical protein
MKVRSAPGSSALPGRPSSIEATARSLAARDPHLDWIASWVAASTRLLLLATSRCLGTPGPGPAFMLARTQEPEGFVTRCP